MSSSLFFSLHIILVSNNEILGPFDQHYKYSFECMSASPFANTQRFRSSGSDDVKKNMVKTLAEMELTDHSKVTLFEDGALEPLLQLVSHSNVHTKTMAVKVLEKLSSFHQNGLQMIRARAVHPLLDLLHLHITSSPSLREEVAATIMNIAISARLLGPDETLGFLESDDEISRLFSLIMLTGPNIQQRILQTFYALCQLQQAGDMRAKLRQVSIWSSLFPLVWELKCAYQHPRCRHVTKLVK